MSTQMYYILSLVVATLILLPVSYIDWKQKIIPNWAEVALVLSKVGILLAYVVLWWRSSSEGNRFMESVAADVMGEAGKGLLLGVVIVLFSRFLAKDGLGMGDVKLLLTISFFLGATVFLRAMVLLSLFLLPVAVVLLATKKMTKEGRIPFAPFLFLGTLTSLLLEIF